MQQKLTLMQLADSFFPSGSYTLSHGLETLVQQRRISNGSDLLSFVKILLHNKIASCDLVALIYSYQGSAANDLDLVRQADTRLFAQTAIAINRHTQRQSGRALLMVARSTWKSSQLETLAQDSVHNRFHCLHPVIFGVVGNIAGIDLNDTALAFLHSLMTSLLGAAIRLGIIGYLEAQKILLQLATDIEISLHNALNTELAHMWSCTPQIDLAQMHHSKLGTRLFAS